jgi:DNA replication protein DnaC
MTEIKERPTKEKPNNIKYPSLTPKFDTFGEARLQKMLSAAAQFAADLNNTEPYWLSLLGPSGIGKTMLARSVYRHFMEHSRFNTKVNPIEQRVVGNSGEFCNWRRFCAEVRCGSFGRIEDICDDWFVVIDDVGSEHDPNGFVASMIDRVFNERQKKWTLITSNFNFQQIAERIDSRVASRMIRNGGKIVECDAVDFSLRVPS